METQDSIREFWFGSHPDDTTAADRQAKLWWSKDPALDAGITTRFAELTDRAASGTLDAWRLQPVGRLSLILLCDQFPRNMYRNTPKAFAFDALAREICQEGLARHDDRQLGRLERVFFYLPLEHSESLEDQDQSVQLFSDLLREAPAADKRIFEGFFNFAVRHREVIRRFQRFPHRNTQLGRASSPEEISFLAQPGSSF